MGIDVKVESPYGTDGETLHDPQARVSTLLVMSNLERTKCLGFIDPYGDTVFNQMQIPVLIAELEEALTELSPSRLRSHREVTLEAARGATWDATIIKEHEREASASDDQLRSEIASVKSHTEKVLGVLQEAANAGPHHFVRFVGD